MRVNDRRVMSDAERDEGEKRGGGDKVRRDKVPTISVFRGAGPRTLPTAQLPTRKPKYGG